MRCSCGSEWFVEERIIRPAGLPREVQHYPMGSVEHPRYRYRCADCGLLYGEAPAKTTTRKPRARKGS